MLLGCQTFEGYECGPEKCRAEMQVIRKYKTGIEAVKDL